MILVSALLLGCGSAGKRATGAGTTANASAAASTAPVAVPAGEVVAQVGNVAITKNEVTHWMTTFMTGDFYELTKFKAPQGLVSEPADIPRCVRATESIITIASKRPAPATLRGKCELLHRAIRRQAVAYLISAYSAVGQAAEMGIELSKSEVEQRFRELQAHDFPTEAQLQRYLAQRQRSLSDELFLVKRNALSERLVDKLKQQAGGAEAKLIKYGTELESRWVAKTACQPAYMAEGCRGFTQDAKQPSGAVLVEEMAKWHKPSPRSGT